MANIYEKVRNIALGVADDPHSGSMSYGIYLQQIRDAILGKTNTQYGTASPQIYLQQIRDALLGVPDRKFGGLEEVIYLQQIRNAILGVPDGQFGSLDAGIYWGEILDAALAMGMLGGGAAPNTLLDDLIGAWDFHETSGNFADLAGTGPTLTASVGTLRDNGMLGRQIHGAQGAGPYFVTAGTNSVFDNNANQSFTFAVLATIRSNNTGTDHVFTKAYGNAYEYKLITDSSAFYWAIGNGATQTGVVADTFPEWSGGWWGTSALVICYYNAVTKKIGIKVQDIAAAEADVSAITIEHQAGSKFNVLGLFDLNYKSACSVHFLARWDRLLTSTEMATLYNNKKYINYPFTQPAADNSYKLVFDGDSLTGQYSYPLTLFANKGVGHPYANFGVGSQRTDQILARQATTLASYNAGCTKNFLIIQGGTNDLWTARTAGQIYADLASYCTAAKSAGFTVIIWTIPKNGVANAGQETVRTTVNASILAMGALVDGIVDVGNDATLATPTDLDYFCEDKVHFSPKGNSYIAISLVKPILDGLIA